MNPLPNIALTGRMGTGKSTIAQLLSEMYGYHRISWAAPVKDFAAMAYGPIDKTASYAVTQNGVTRYISGREILQRLGTDALRMQVDQDFWIKVGLNRIRAALTANPNVRIVIDDTRFPNEADALRARGFLIVRVKLPDALRLARMDEEPGDRIHNHPSETLSDTIPAHLDIWNTADSHATVQELMRVLAETVATETA